VAKFHELRVVRILALRSTNAVDYRDLFLKPLDAVLKRQRSSRIEATMLQYTCQHLHSLQAMAPETSSFSKLVIYTKADVLL
jgi:hypothetical protein